MKYAFSVTENGITYSLDMIRLRVEIGEYKLKNLFQILSDNEDHRIFNIYEDHRELKYRHFVNLLYVNNKSIKMGFYVNGASYENRHLGFIEFNPNSFATLNEFWNDFNYIKSFFPYKDIVRFDIAIDIPIARNKVVMVKDNRTYTAIRKSPLDFTEHLGRRNTVGRIKLYNKTIESKLDYDLTRLEITADLEHINIPHVFDLRNIPPSDKDLFNAILKNDYFTLALSDLSLYKRLSILKHIESNEIHFSHDCITKVIDYAKELAI